MSHSISTIQLASTKAALVLTLMLCCGGSHAETINSIVRNGNHEGFFYSFYKDNGKASMNLEAGGRYTSTWNRDTNNWFGGLGWQSADSKIIHYSGTFEPDGIAYLSLYGWSKNPKIEFYIIESWTTYDPSNCSFGNISARYQTDGANYELHHCEHFSLSPEKKPDTYYSMRVPKKQIGAISGTIDVAKHFEEWRRAGLELPANDYAILATEGYQSQGRSDITIREVARVSSSSSSSGSTASPSALGGALDYIFLVFTPLIAARLRWNRRTMPGRSRA